MISIDKEDQEKFIHVFEYGLSDINKTFNEIRLVLLEMIELSKNKIMKKLTIEEINFRQELSYIYGKVLTRTILDKIRDEFYKKTNLFLYGSIRARCEGSTKIDDNVFNHIKYVDFRAYNDNGDIISLTYEQCKMLSDILREENIF